MSSKPVGEDIPPAPPMTEDQTLAYRAELRNELADLEFHQALHPSDYKMERIKRLEQRLGITHP